MNLSDKEILELNQLCNGLMDGTLSESQKERLAARLADSEEARRFYVRAMGLSASLCAYASEMQVEALDAPHPEPAPWFSLVWRWLGPLAAAACVIFFCLWLSGLSRRDTPADEVRKEEFVARLTGAKDCRWPAETAPVQAGSVLRKGRTLTLESGFAEITFDSGAQVVLEGPASLDINSAWDATLHRGALKANVPVEAMGFRISSAAVEVVDLGTEFSMISDGSGAADVFVLKGMIEASPRDSSDQRTIVLHEKQARRFAPSGISKVADVEQKFARFSQPVAFEPFLPPTEYVHWSFDEPGGDVLVADAFGRMPIEAFNARLEGLSDTVLETARTPGRWRSALRFNGHLYANAAFPGLSGDMPHTVAFWVKVPEDAHLPNAYAMVAWGVSSSRLGSHPVHIGWNRNPTEGPVGVLRTDYGGGYALGATSLRDGRWHHVGVVFVPCDDPNVPVEVKQYVDGRFEGEGRPSPPGTEISAKFSESNMAALRDTLWLGCRIGINGPRRDRFRGEMDELCIANRALEPREIVQLMKENRPLPTEVASVEK